MPFPRHDLTLAALHSDQLAQPEVLALAYAATVRSLIALITALNEQVKLLEEQVREHLGDTRTLRSSRPSRDWDRSSAPGCLQSSATTRAATATARPEGTTPRPARSPSRQARERSSRSGSCTTADSPARSTPRPGARQLRHSQDPGDQGLAGQAPSVLPALHPASSSWLNLAGRWFAELSNRKLRRSAHRSVTELETDIRKWITQWNKNPKPFVWTKSADEILETLAAYCQRIIDSGH